MAIANWNVKPDRNVHYKMYELRTKYYLKIDNNNHENGV
jgi:hypothetical protein